MSVDYESKLEAIAHDILNRTCGDDGKMHDGKYALKTIMAILREAFPEPITGDMWDGDQGLGQQPTRAKAEADELIKLLDKAHDIVVALCHGERWTMHIPARPDSDPDLVIGRALREARAFILAARRPSAEPAKDARDIADYTWGHYYSAERAAAEIERFAQARAAIGKDGQ